MFYVFTSFLSRQQIAECCISPTTLKAVIPYQLITSTTHHNWQQLALKNFFLCQISFLSKFSSNQLRILPTLDPGVSMAKSSISLTLALSTVQYLMAFQ